MLPLDPATVELAGKNLVEASAGTGKTTAITSIYLRLVAECALTPEQILVVTYTRAATAELRDRIRTKIRAALARLEGEPCADTAVTSLLEQLERRVPPDQMIERLRDALTRLDRAAIHTIHGFCQRMLEERAFESGGLFESELIESDRDLLEEIATDFWTHEVAKPSASATFAAWALDGNVLSKSKDPADRMIALLQHATAPVEPTLAPARPADPPDSTDLEDEWRAAIDATALLWQQDRERVIEILATNPAWDGRSYRPESIRKNWVPALDNGLEIRTTLLLDQFDKLALLTPPGMKTKKGKAAPEHPFFDACERLHAIEAQLAVLRDDLGLSFWHRLVEHGRGELCARKQRDRLRTYDDLLVELRDGLAAARGAALAERIRAAFPAVLIDEFQDTDPVQTEIFHRIYDQAEGPVFLVGDPKQAIYSFRGADLYAYLDVAGTVTGRAFSLDTNHRSDPAYVAALNFLYGRTFRPFEIDGIDYRAVEAAKPNRVAGPTRFQVPFEVLFVDGLGGDDEAPTGKPQQRDLVQEVTSTEIAELLGAGVVIDGRPVDAADVAVLVRNRRQANAMQAALRARGIPVVLRSHESVLSTSVAEDLVRILRAIASPEHAAWIRAALATDLLGEDAERLAALQNDEAQWEEWVARFRAWRDDWDDHGFMTAFRRLLDDRGIRARLLARPGGERALTDLLHLGELAHQAETEGRLGGLGTLRWLEHAHAEARAGGGSAAEEAQLRLESDEPAVQIVTIHAAKGLEYPIVYCPYLWEAPELHPADKVWLRYHDPEAPGRLILDLRGGGIKNEEPTKIAKREREAEELRLMYVALTRARHRTSVVWGAFKGAEKSPLARLLGVPTTREAASNLAAESGGTVAVVGIGTTDPAPARGPLPASAQSDPDALRSRSLSRAVDPAWRISSYSGLTAGREARPELEPLSRSVDESDAPTSIAPEITRVVETEPLPLAAVPGGARTGEMLHKLFETIDFATTTSEGLRRVARDTLAAFGFRDAGLVEPVASAVEIALRTPLTENIAALTLSTVGMRDRLTELEFVFPIGAEGGTAPGLLTGAHLATVFGRRAGPPWSPAYPDSLRRLGFPALSGFLRGFIDLAFTSGGRWYVLDYKSDFLGRKATDYAPEHLAHFMEAHHYLLQYHVYTIALHRHLAQRVAGYDYDRDFGGVVYLFLRGLTASGAGCYGVFRDRPPRETIEALSAAFSAPGTRA